MCFFSFSKMGEIRGSFFLFYGADIATQRCFKFRFYLFFSLTETDMGFLNPSPSIWIYIRARQCFLFRFYRCFTLFSFREADMSRGFNGLEDKMGGYLWIFEGCLSFICGSFMNYLWFFANSRVFMDSLKIFPFEVGLLRFTGYCFEFFAAWFSRIFLVSPGFRDSLIFI